MHDCDKCIHKDVCPGYMVTMPSCKEFLDIGRCAVLPNIPYNKTLYWIWGDKVMPVHYRGILGGCVTKDEKYHITCNMITKKPRSFVYTLYGVEKVSTYPAGDKRMFYADDIGKTVFLTREEAEKALKGGAE